MAAALLQAGQPNLLADRHSTAFFEGVRGRPACAGPARTEAPNAPNPGQRLLAELVGESIRAKVRVALEHAQCLVPRDGCHLHHRKSLLE